MSRMPLQSLKPQLNALLKGLDFMGSWLPQLVLRCLLAHEFWSAGLEKLHGANWFLDIQDRFPFPLHYVPPEVSWQLATWLELVGPVALVLGLGTRLVAGALSVLTLVAIYSVHAGLGYNVCDSGWKLPLIYLAMFLPLIFSGPGKLSLDHWIRRSYGSGERRLWS